jgi:predicted Fe-Mo cluster-binding NifX family protein
MELGVSTLICTAISGQCANMVEREGIELITFTWISGQREEVLNAFLRGNLLDTQFLMHDHPSIGKRLQEGFSGETGRGEDAESTFYKKI